MSNELISPDLVDVALNRVSGSVFEDFAIELLAALLGVDLIPLGGMHDGGADAVVEGLAEDAAQPRWFVQASVEQDTPGKIKRTVDRLRDVGRQPQRLTYVTSQVVKRVDLVERDLTLELDVDIHIRDAAYIRAHINDTPLTRAAFNNRLRSLTEFLRFPGSAPLITASKHVQSPAVYVFLRQEMDRRTGETSLVDAVADSLILWSLEGTDPDAGRFLTETEVAERIFAELPAAKALIAPVLRRRLEALADKSHPGGRVVRWHRKDDHFCLPFESRSRIEEENLADESLRLRVIAILEQRIRDLAD